MSSKDNLPPGCSSADGGIDHELEAALDRLVEAAEGNPEVIAVLAEMAPIIMKSESKAYWSGYEEAQYGEDQ